MAWNAPRHESEVEETYNKGERMFTDRWLVIVQFASLDVGQKEFFSIVQTWIGKKIQSNDCFLLKRGIKGRGEAIQ